MRTGSRFEDDNLYDVYITMSNLYDNKRINREQLNDAHYFLEELQYLIDYGNNNNEKKDKKNDDK